MRKERKRKAATVQPMNRRRMKGMEGDEGWEEEEEKSRDILRSLERWTGEDLRISGEGI